MPRPLLVSTLFYIAGLILARSFLLPPWLLFFAFAVCLAAVIYNYRWAWRKNWVFLFCLMVIIGMIMFQWETQRNESTIDQMADSWAVLTGTVIEAPNVRSGRVNYVLKVDHELTAKGSNRSLSGSVLLTVYGQAEKFAYGDKLVLSGIPELPKEPGNPGEFDYRQYLKDRGIQLIFRSIQGSGIKKIGSGRQNFFVGRTIELRYKLAGVLNSVLPEKQAGFMEGILFGSRGRLDYDIRADFAAAGIVHVLSVSGYHVGLVVGFLFLLGRLIGLPKKYLYVVILGTTAFYAVMAGASSPVLRAVTMTWILLLSTAAGNKCSRSDALSLAALVILVIDPSELFSIGFQLSFSATWGILFFAPLLRRLMERPLTALNRQFPWASPFGESIIYIIAAQTAVLPAAVYYFNFVSLVSLPANLVLVPIISFIMLMGWFVVLTGVIWLPLASAAAFSLSKLLALVFWAADAFAGIPFAAAAVKPPDAYEIGIYYALLVFSVELVRNRELNIRARRIWSLHRRALSLGALVLIFILMWAGIITPGKTYLEVTFLDVGQGDSAVIISPAGRCLVIDTGGVENPFSTYRPGETVVIPFLRHRGINSVEMLLLSHAHADHIQGAWSLLERVRVKTLVVSRSFAENPDCSRLIDAFRQKGTQIMTVGGGERIVFGENINLEVFSPLSNSETNENDNSIISRLLYEKFKVLFTGDAEEASLTWLMRDNKDIRSEIVKVPHHGSTNGWVEGLFRAAEPTAAVISVGRNNFGHPAGEVLEGLSRLGISIFRTDMHGAVTVRSDGRGYRLETGRRID